jgi:hypothetical protein
VEKLEGGQIERYNIKMGLRGSDGMVVKYTATYVIMML